MLRAVFGSIESSTVGREILLNPQSESITNPAGFDHQELLPQRVSFYRSLSLTNNVSLRNRLRTCPIKSLSRAMPVVRALRSCWLHPKLCRRPSLCALAHGEKLRNRNFSYGQRPHHSRSTH